MTAIRAGQLHRRVTLQKRNPAQDTFGAQKLEWIEACTLWADVQPLSGTKLENAQRVASDVSHSITIRYQKRFTDTREVSNYRGLYNGRIFNILGCYNPDESNVLITLVAQEGLSEV